MRSPRGLDRVSGPWWRSTGARGRGDAHRRGRWWWPAGQGGPARGPWWLQDRTPSSRPMIGLWWRAGRVVAYQGHAMTHAGVVIAHQGSAAWLSPSARAPGRGSLPRRDCDRVCACRATGGPVAESASSTRPRATRRLRPAQAPTKTSFVGIALKNLSDPSRPTLQDLAHRDLKLRPDGGTR